MKIIITIFALGLLGLIFVPNIALKESSKQILLTMIYYVQENCPTEVLVKENKEFFKKEYEIRCPITSSMVWQNTSEGTTTITGIGAKNGEFYFEGESVESLVRQPNEVVDNTQSSLNEGFVKVSDFTF